MRKLEGEVNELALQVQHERQEGRLLQQELGTTKAELAAAHERIVALIAAVEKDKEVRECGLPLNNVLLYHCAASRSVSWGI